MTICVHALRVHPGYCYSLILVFCLTIAFVNCLNKEITIKTVDKLTNYLPLPFVPSTSKNPAR